MNRRDKGEGRFFRYEKESPSFSSTLLDQIYRSIDDDRGNNSDDLRLFRETMAKKKSSRRTEDVEEEEEDMASFRRACLVEKWMDKKVGEKVVSQRRRQFLHYSESERRFTRTHRPNYSDANDALFFSSTSSSSDSSSGGFSSSDTDSIFGAARSAPARPKAVRTSVVEKKLAEIRVRNASCHEPQDEEALIKSKSRALKIYNNLKKVKQPISPGGKLSGFLNSLFAPSKKSSVATTTETPAAPSTATSFSRSCLSKNSPASGGLKRSVRFYPVSVIVDEDSRPCGHKSLYGDEQTVLMPVAVPTAWKIGRSSVGESDQKIHRKGEQVTATEFLRDYRQNQKKNELMIMKDREFRSKEDIKVRSKEEEEEDDDDMDDSASYSSSDLFELDHLAELGKEVRYQEELPVYETTRVDRNRPIF